MRAQTLFATIVATSACVAPSEDEATSSVVNARTVISLTFDDTLADQYQVGDMAAARGMRAVFYVNSTRIGTSGYMSKAQLIALQQAGHELGGHTLTHVNLTTLSDADARTQVCDDRAALLDQGFRITSFAYPFGADNATVQNIVAGCGYNSARDVGGLQNTTTTACSGCPWANPVPPANLYMVRTDDSIDSTTPLATMQQYVIDAENNGGGYVPMVFHHVCDGCASNAVSPATLATFLDWLQQRAPATQVGTVDQEIGGSVQPRVSTTEPSSNMLKNPSLEADTDGNQVPDCWQRGGYGTNSGAFTLVTDAYDGARAQQITITKSSSGGRRLVSAQDSGACAPAVTAGHRYTVSAYYEATTQPRFTVYYRNTSGKWAYFAESALLPTSAAYQQATYTTPAMPSDATAISVGLGIFAVGSITMDAYTLADVNGPAPGGDVTPPSITLLCNGTACSPNGYATPVSVSLSAWDFSGIASLRYTTDGSDPASGGTTYTAPFSISATATVRAVAIDPSGNSSPLTRTIQISGTDTTPPSLSIACNGAACTSTPYSAAVTVTLSASDTSGIQDLLYTTDGSDPATSGTPYTGAFTIGATATVRAITHDHAGLATTLSQTITIQVTTPTNLLQNASLETDADSNGVPDCWVRAGFGTNTATFGLVSDAYDGARAENVTISSWSSGARRLVSAQDGGTCAPAATPGRSYTMTARYKSTIHPRFSVYYRNTSGTWAWFAESPLLPVASSYTPATYTTPALPSDATAISIGLSIFEAGSLTSDAYTLVEAP